MKPVFLQTYKTGDERMEETLSQIGKTIKQRKKIIKSDSIVNGIANASRDYDIVVIGATKESLFKKMLFGEIPEKVARFSPTSVLVVKKNEGGVKSIMKKVLG